MSDVEPIFLLSLPRSGSTLLQRIIARNDRVATMAEPRILLPLLYSIRDQGVFAEYKHGQVVRSARNFIARLPAGERDYRDAIRRWAETLYTLASPPGRTHFLDKSPTYAAVAGDILETFPRAKVILLWRNPLAVVASLCEDLADGRWRLYAYEQELFGGLAALVEAEQKYRNRMTVLRYEQLVDDPEPVCRRIFDYLGLPFDPAFITEFSRTDLKGRPDDRTLDVPARVVSSESVHKWRHTICNPLRKRWCRKYLAWIGRDRLASMGYDFDVMAKEIQTIPFSLRHLPSDLLSILRDTADRLFEATVLKSKLLKFRRGEPIWKHC